MLRTRITELFGIKHPILLAGMNYITEPGLVSTVCNAGGFGLLATAHLKPEEIRKNIKEIRERTDKPFGVNQSLRTPGAMDNIEVMIQEKVPMINYSLGRPNFIDRVHEYGGKVTGTIAVARHAVRAEQLGVDALIITGHEAGAHGADATSFVLIPIVASMVKVPLIAAGGIFDGRGLAAALALGADAVSMGTRFMVTKESIIHQRFKELCVKATEQDTLYSNAFDGMPGRVLKTEEAERLIKKRFPLFGAMGNALEIKRLLKLSFREYLRTIFDMVKGGGISFTLEQAIFGAGMVRLERAIFDGDEKRGVLYAGQNCGGIQDIPSCEELINRIVTQAEEILQAADEKWFRH